MTLSPEMRAHFEDIGPEAVLLEIAQGKHGQAEDSPLRMDARLWVEGATQRRNQQALDIAVEARNASRLANLIALLALLVSVLAVVVGFLQKAAAS